MVLCGRGPFGGCFAASMFTLLFFNYGLLSKFEFERDDASSSKILTSSISSSRPPSQSSGLSRPPTCGALVFPPAFMGSGVENLLGEGEASFGVHVLPSWIACTVCVVGEGSQDLPQIPQFKGSLQASSSEEKFMRPPDRWPLLDGRCGRRLWSSPPVLPKSTPAPPPSFRAHRSSWSCPIQARKAPPVVVTLLIVSDPPPNHAARPACRKRPDGMKLPTWVCGGCLPPPPSTPISGAMLLSQKRRCRRDLPPPQSSGLPQPSPVVDIDNSAAEFVLPASSRHCHQAVIECYCSHRKTSHRKSTMYPLTGISSHPHSNEVMCMSTYSDQDALYQLRPPCTHSSAIKL